MHLFYRRYRLRGYKLSPLKNNLSGENDGERTRHLPRKNDEDAKVRRWQHPPLARQPRGAQLDELRRHPP